MRYRMLAAYKGVPYEAGVGPSGADVVLFAACPPPEELGFEPATGHWRKRVIRAEIDALWESRPVGTFRDEPCLVLDDLGDRLHIAYLGTDPEGAARLGYWQIDRGVFELLTPREDVTGLTEERVDRPLWPTAIVPGPQQGTGPAHPYGDPDPAAPPDVTAPVPPVPPVSGSPAGALDSPAPPGALDSPAPPGALDSPAPPGALDSPAPPGALDAPAPPGALSPAPQEPPVTPTAPKAPENGGRAARRQRVATRDVFCELADLAAIPRSAYALETEVDGALCLMRAGTGYEVFVAADGARHEIRSFPDEESAYFYLFGVLAAEAVRNGVLAAAPSPGAAI